MEHTSGYRTRAKAGGNLAEIPSYLPVITNRRYQNAMSLNEDSTAYLQPIQSAGKIIVEDGKLLFAGLPATAARLRSIYTDEDIENIDLPLLKVLYGIILERFEKTIEAGNFVEEVVTIYYPDFARRIGKSSHISRNDVEAFIRSILRFQSIMGVTDKGSNILPVLVYMGEDRSRNTISFSSPYMVRIITEVYKASIRRDPKGIPLKRQNGFPFMKPAYSYLIKSTIVKERNHKAVECVMIIVRTIELAGNNNIPHIRAKTIVERNRQLLESLNRAKRTSDKSIMLKRAFSKAFELLLTQTRLTEVYTDIKLPDPKEADFQTRFIPTMSTIDTMVYEFPHKGKRKALPVTKI